ncbi:MAG: hypothetical protein AB8B65_05900 [Kordia sp.]|uniref:hypothetical protein n=1 Tax=Kordia sp. TaxID=1965332 RepID=UPI00385E76AB
MSLKLPYFLVFVFFFCSNLTAQGLRVTIGNRTYPIKDLHVAKNAETGIPKTKKSFNFYRRHFSDLIYHQVFYDDYYLFHLDKPRDSERYESNDIVLMPKHNMVLTKINGALKMTPYTTFFKKGGFTKTGDKKIIYGQKAEKYSITPSFLNMEIWIGKSDQNNQLTDLYRSFGLMNAIPKDEKVLAIVHNGIEIDVALIRYQKESKRWLTSKFDLFMDTSNAVQAQKNDCEEERFLKDIEISQLPKIPATATFLYKTKYRSTVEKLRFTEEVRKDTTTAYWNDKQKIFLQLYDANDTNSDKFLFMRDLRIAVLGPIVADTFQVKKAKKEYGGEDCDEYSTPTLVNKKMQDGRELTTYIFIDKRSNEICTIVMDEKSEIDTSYLFPYFNLPKGEVVKSQSFSHYYRYTTELSTVKTSKKITLDVKN